MRALEGLSAARRSSNTISAAAAVAAAAAGAAAGVPGAGDTASRGGGGGQGGIGRTRRRPSGPRGRDPAWSRTLRLHRPAGAVMCSACPASRAPHVPSLSLLSPYLAPSERLRGRDSRCFCCCCYHMLSPWRLLIPRGKAGGFPSPGAASHHLAAWRITTPHQWSCFPFSAPGQVSCSDGADLRGPRLSCRL